MTSVEQSRLRRYTFLERALILAITVGTLIGMGTAAIALSRQSALVEQQRQIVCIARLTADFQAAVGDAFAAPSSSDARTRAVVEITRTSKRLHAIEQVC